MQLQASIPRTPVASLFRAVAAPFSKLFRRVLNNSRTRRLRLCETISLANRGYVAVVRYGDHKFLIGGTSSSIALLAQLPGGMSGTAAPASDEFTGE